MSNAETLQPIPEQHADMFVHGGRALFTVVSKKTGARFTFKCQKPREKVEGEDARPIFVKVLTGSDNEASYTFLGTIFADGHYVHSRKSSIGEQSPSSQAFTWLLKCLDAGKLSSLELYHHGKCGCCGRTLTVPESVIRGIGPECQKKGG